MMLTVNVDVGLTYGEFVKLPQVQTSVEEYVDPTVPVLACCSSPDSIQCPTFNLLLQPFSCQSSKSTLPPRDY